MPKIISYDQRQTSGGPVQMPSGPTDALKYEGLSKLGEGIASFGDSLYQRAEQREVSDLTAKLAEKQAQYTTQWQENLRTADPGDDKLTEKFMQKFDDEFTDMGNEIQTTGAKRFFQESSAKLRAHMFESAAQGQAELAGEKATLDYKRALNGFSSSLVDDPRALNLSLENHNTAIDALVQSGRLPQAKALEFKQKGETELTKSAIEGWIKLNPEFTKEQIHSGRWDKNIDGDLKVQLLGRADTEISARFTEAERQKRAIKEAKEKQDTVIENDFLTQMVDGSLSAKKIVESQIEPDKKRIYLNMIKENAQKGITSDPVVFSETFRRIHLPEDDPRKLTDEGALNKLVTSRQLSIKDLNFLRGELQNKGTEQGKIESDLKSQLYREADSVLVKKDMFGIPDPNSQVQMSKFVSYATNKLIEQRKSGKPLKELLDASSPQYLGLEIGKYKKTPQQIQTEIIERMRSQSLKTSGPKAEAISQMTKEDLSKLDPKSLTPEQSQAARDRYNALNKGAQ